MGFQKENIIMVDLPGYQASKAKVMIDLLKSNPDIERVSLGIGAPLSGSNITSSFQRIEDFETNYHANMKTVDTSYFKLYDLKLVAGSWGKASSINDTVYNIVVNKTLARKIGFKKPMDAIDQYLYILGRAYAKITGVAEDFHAYTFRREIPPVIFVSYEDFFQQVHIKTNGKPYSELEDFIKSCWNEVYPEYVYSYDVLEDSIERRYSSERRTSQIIKTFTFIAIIIASLGLYGLVSFMLVQRTKEIGIRKALGASVSTVIWLVTKQFLKLVIIACLFAWPFAYYLMRGWLSNYVYRIDLNIWIFFASGLLLVVVTFLTILYQSVKVSKTKPADVLKYE
jgi:ABC-type antimicrobial peptide transport system permease subunit